MKARIVLFGLLMATTTLPLGAGEPITMRVSPAVAFAPANLIVRATIEADSENRAVVVTADSADFYRASEMQLNGEQAPRTNTFEFRSLPPGSYEIQVQKPGFGTQVAKDVVLQVSQNTLQNFSLKVAESNTIVTVESTLPVVDSTTMTVGQVIDKNVVQEIPLNGRHFVDLAQLVPGTVTPPQSGFLTAPLRGQGSFAFNSAGGREDAVNFMINGVNLNDMVQNQVTFQPTIAFGGISMAKLVLPQALGKAAAT